MTNETWEKHANPWSVWSRMITLPILVLAIWSRIWIGWYGWVIVGILVIWLILNPKAFKKPTERLFAQQASDTKSRRALAGQLIAKSTVGDAAKAWKEYGKYTGLSEEAFYKQYGRSKLYKDEPTPQMKQAKLKGDFVKNLTKKKNFLQESDVDSNEAAQIFEGYQSLVNGNKDLAKQIDSGQLYIPKSAESFEQVKGGFVPNDTDGMRTNKIYFDFNNLMGQGQTWFLFDGTKLIPKARVD